MKSAPCGDCKNRGCGTYHDECPTYLTWKKEKQALSEKIRKERQIDSAFRRRRKHYTQ